MALKYDPRQHGAECDRCPLKHLSGDKWTPVPPEINPKACGLVVADYPGDTEVSIGRPLIGRAGQEMDRAVQASGYRRPDLSYTNAMLCKHPTDKLERVLARVREANRRIKAENKKRPKDKQKALWPTPMEACRPRLVKEVAKHGNVLVAGGYALSSLLQQKVSQTAMAGAPLPVELLEDGQVLTWEQQDDNGEDQEAPGLGQPLKLLPTFNPAAVCYERKWRQVFQADVAKAFRWFVTGELRWQPPKLTYNPTPRQLRDFLASGAAFYAVDLETDHIESLLAKIRCIGVATENEAMIVSFLSMDGESTYYTESAQARVKQLLVDFLENPKITKVGHNFRYYDMTVLETQWNCHCKRVIDTIILHRLAESEYPHSLGFAGRRFTDTGAWKTEHAATSARSDKRLWRYNGVDCAVNWRIVPPLTERVKATGQAHLVQGDMKLQDLARGMHKRGLLVDQKKRQEFEDKYKKEAKEWGKILFDAAGFEFNPASTNDINDLLYEKWKLPPLAHTEITGKPKTDDDVIRTFMFDKSVDKTIRTALGALRRYRRAMKYLGTYILKLAPTTIEYDGEFILWDEDADDEEREDAFRRKVNHRRGAVLADGRIHPNYNVHAAKTGRFSSSGPNAQNFVRFLRDMIVPTPGYTFFAADMDQLELRFAAAYWGAVAYLKVFNELADPHSLTACMIFPNEFPQLLEKREWLTKQIKAKGVGVEGYVAELEKVANEIKGLRDFAKRFSYAVLYGATDETVHGVLLAVENKKGELIYAESLTPTQTRQRKRRWLSANPEIERGWEKTVQLYRKQGYLVEPVDQRRRDFLNGEEFNELVNFPIQAGGASVVNRGTREFMDRLAVLVDEIQRKEGMDDPAWINNQTHDSLMGECRIEVVERVKAELQQSLTRRVDGLNVLFSAEAKNGYTWGTV